MKDNKLPEIPSEFIEPYLAKFMGSMISFITSSRTKEQIEERGGIGWTIQDVKCWIKGVELFVSETCGIHARYAMMNGMYKFNDIPDDELYKICKKIEMEYYERD